MNHATPQTQIITDEYDSTKWIQVAAKYNNGICCPKQTKVGPSWAESQHGAIRGVFGVQCGGCNGVNGAWITSRPVEFTGDEPDAELVAELIADVEERAAEQDRRIMEELSAELVQTLRDADIDELEETSPDQACPGYPYIEDGIPAVWDYSSVEGETIIVRLINGEFVTEIA